MGTRGQSKKMVGHTTLFLMVLAGSTQAEKCLHPPPSENYSNQLYAGRWFEVGKYQTLGGSIFQIGTVCTEANFIPYGEVGDGDIGYSSRTDSRVLWIRRTPNRLQCDLHRRGLSIEYDCTQQ